MASIWRELRLDAPADRVWNSISDFGAVHTRVAPGFVVECHLGGDTRVVTFSNGTVARELLVDCDEEKRRLAYAVKSVGLRSHAGRVGYGDVHSVVHGRTRLVHAVAAKDVHEEDDLIWRLASNVPVVTHVYVSSSGGPPPVQCHDPDMNAIDDIACAAVIEAEALDGANAPIEKATRPYAIGFKGLFFI